MSAFADALAESHKRPGTQCVIGVLLTTLDPADSADLKAAIVSSDVTASAISRALSAMGLKVADGSIGRHRRGDCRCE